MEGFVPELEALPGRRGRRPRLFTPSFALILFSTLAYFLSVGVLLPVFPRFIEGPLRGSDVAVGLSGGAFSLAAVVLRPISGRVGDRRGRRPLMVGGAAFVGAAIAGTNLVHGLPLLMALRFVSGVGEAMFFVGAASAANDLAPEERRGEAVSLFSLSLYGGIALGPFLGEAILGSGRFGRVWWVSTAFAFVALVLALRVRDARPPSDVSGTRRGRLIHPAAVVPGLVLASTVWAFAAFGTFVTLYALRLGMSGVRFVFLTYAVTVLLIRLLGARIPDVLGPRRAATVATSTVATGMLVMGAWGSPAGLYVATFVFGVGQAFAFPALITLAVRGAPSSERGAVVGTYTAFVDLAFGVGAVSLGAVSHAVGYRGTFAVSSGIALAGLVLLRTVVRERRAVEPPAGQA